MIDALPLSLSSMERRLDLRRELLERLLLPIAAGAPLPESLLESAKDHPSRAIRLALERLAAEISRGTPLSDALATLGPLSDEMLVAAARAGERSGRMAEALEACEAAMDLRVDVARGLADEMLQPLLSVACAVGFIAVILLAGTIPQFLELTGTRGPTTQVLGRIAAHPALSIAALLAGCVAIAALARLVPSTRAGSSLLDWLPLVGPMRIESRMGLLCRHVALATDAGVPLDEALASSAAILPRWSRERRAILAMVTLVRAGEPPDAAAREAGGVPALLVAILSAPGPDRVSLRVARLARWHESEAARFGEELRALAGPLAVVAAGLACGFVIVLAWTGYFTALTYMAD